MSEKLETVSQVLEKCPAFMQGCPYTSILNDEETVRVAQKCPEFESHKCPFSTLKIDDLQIALAKIPPSHLDKNEISHVISSAMQKVHQISTSLEDEVGHCPMFSQECIFKVKCTNLQPLIKELDLMTWGILIKKAGKAETDGEIHLASQLKTGTADAHRAAESVHFVRQFLRGKVDKASYQVFVGYLYFIYQALETAANLNHSHDLYKEIHFPNELNRCESLAQDLTHYYGEDWEKKIESLRSSPAVKNYVARIEEVGRNHPHLLVAHSYTRYLGDLSGGQVLKKVATKTYGLTDGNGTRFYDFETMPTPKEHKAFKNKYRSILDGLPVDAELASEIVKEANKAFHFNTQLFEELDVLCGFATKEEQEALAKIIAQNTTKGEAKCPFANMGNKDFHSTTASSSVSQAEKENTLGWKIHLILKPYYPYMNTIFMFIGAVFVGYMLRKFAGH